ncbi:hypothetical protein BHY_1340 (plasmid) [Borrelia nietonii YOR]|uniref:Uncharacterized protein n=2 Tax=Borrelia TaxID=138 RepID=W5SGP2_9SPIR|nr:hypothetical protein BHY_1340 [Borrelia nietonii YOR]AHH14677.1 hypothetical protein BHW_0011304 [Borrelia hermsii MTW]UPA09998.1 hypothetical protein bhYOR_001329 [Borrelia nietonii YOR]
MQQFGLYYQKMLEDFESFAFQGQGRIKDKQKGTSKISRIGRKLPKVGKTACFKFNN